MSLRLRRNVPTLVLLIAILVSLALTIGDLPIIAYTSW